MGWRRASGRPVRLKDEYLFNGHKPWKSLVVSIRELHTQLSTWNMPQASASTQRELPGDSMPGEFCQLVSLEYI